MDKILNHTETFCFDCKTVHPAVILQRDKRIIGETTCQKKTKEVILSDDADLFLRFRSENILSSSVIPSDRSFFYHYLSVTDLCNSNCPVCAANSGAKKNANHISLQQTEAAAKTALKNHARTVVLLGGEPSMHPQLPEIISCLRGYGLNVWMATNGTVIAENESVLETYIKAGLSKICLQLDTLDPETHEIIRGNQMVREKLKAAKAVTDHGIDLGIVATVIPDNLFQIELLCSELLSWEIPPVSIALQGAAHVGRFASDKGNFITREDIINALSCNSNITGIFKEDFHVIPAIPLLDIYLHPDCAAINLLVKESDQWIRASQLFNWSKFSNLALKSKRITDRKRQRAYLYMIIFRSLNRRGVAFLIRSIMHGNTPRIMLIGAGAFMRTDFPDMSRMQRCVSAVITGDCCNSLCDYYRQQMTKTQPTIHNHSIA